MNHPYKFNPSNLVEPTKEVLPMSLPPTQAPRMANYPDARMDRMVDPGRLLRSMITSMLRVVGSPRSTIASVFRTGRQLANTVGTNRRVDQARSTVSTLSGTGVRGCVDGSGGINGTTQFDGVYGVAVDEFGNVYVADACNHRIRKITPDGTTTTFAGNGIAGYANGTGGPSGTAQFNYPYGVAIDTDGNLYVADASNHRIRKISAEGFTTTLAGNGTPGFYDGTGGADDTTQFESPFDVAVDAHGTVYVAETYANRIRSVAPDGSTTTLAGNGTPGFADGTGGANGTAQFNAPYSVDVSSDGLVYVADNLNNRIRVISPDGMGGSAVTTLAGNGTKGFTDGTGQASGTTQFHRPTGVCVSATGTIYVADSLNDRIRQISADGTTTTLAGNRNRGHVDGTLGPKGTAQFSFPFRVAVDHFGSVYLADSDNNCIRKIET